VCFWGGGRHNSVILAPFPNGISNSYNIGMLRRVTTNMAHNEYVDSGQKYLKLREQMRKQLDLTHDLRNIFIKLLQDVLFKM
jgi:hypothetical protein